MELNYLSVNPFAGERDSCAQRGSRRSRSDRRRLGGARLLGELYEHLPQHARGLHPLRKRQPQRRAVELQFETLGVEAHTAPGAVWSTQQLGGVEPARL